MPIAAEEILKQVDAFAMHYAQGIEECLTREKMKVDGKPLGTEVQTARCRGKYEAYADMATMIETMIEERQAKESQGSIATEFFLLYRNDQLYSARANKEELVNIINTNPDFTQRQDGDEPKAKIVRYVIADVTNH